LVSFYGVRGLVAAFLPETWGRGERAEGQRLEREIAEERAQGRLTVPEGASWTHRDMDTTV
jgi:hypothetical protein